jgi:hypothetical protein
MIVPELKLVQVTLQMLFAAKAIGPLEVAKKSSAAFVVAPFGPT